MSQDLSFAVPFCTHDLSFCGMKIKFHRNIQGYLFPSKIHADDKIKASSVVMSNLKTLFPNSTVFQPPLSTDLQDIFLSNFHDISGFFCDPREKISISCFEEDHINLSIHTTSLEFKKIYEDIKTFSSRLESIFNFAKNPYVGFLTSLPEHSGIGISLEAYLFCPHLKDEIEVNPLFSLERFGSSHRFYILKTKNSAGCELTKLITLFLEQIKKIKTLSDNSISTHFKNNKDAVLDEVSKALALLKGSYRLNYMDAFENLLTLKMGFHLGLLSGIEKDTFLHLILNAQRGRLAVYFNKQDSSDDWLHERASWMQDCLKNIDIKI